MSQSQDQAKTETKGSAEAARRAESGPGAETDEELQRRYLRLMADLDNLRRRQSTQLVQELARAKAAVFEDLLPALDDLARARKAPVQSVEQLREGLQAIERRILGALEKQGVERLDATSGPFDPELHEALATVPSTGQPEGHIVEGIRPGYRVNGLLIRPAQVVIAGPPGGGG